MQTYRPRIGDLVSVAVPERVLRCGYAIEFKQVLAELLSTRIEEVHDAYNRLWPSKANRGHAAFLKAANIDRPWYQRYKNMSRQGKSVFQFIAKAMAYKEVGDSNFGGCERMLFTEIDERLVGKEFIVEEWKMNMTGRYFAPSGSTGADEYGEYDYDPGGLDKQKAHRLLLLREAHAMVAPRRYYLQNPGMEDLWVREQVVDVLQKGLSHVVN